MDTDHKRQGLTGDAKEEVAVGGLDATGEGFELAEGGTGFGEATGNEAYANEDAAEDVGGVASVDQNAGTMGNVAEVEFLEATTGAVVEFEALGGKRDSGIGGVVEGILFMFVYTWQTLTLSVYKFQGFQAGCNILHHIERRTLLLYLLLYSCLRKKQEQ